MTRFFVGDKIRITNINTGEKDVCTILDILEDYGGNTYWVKYEDGRLSLEYETPNTIFIKYYVASNEIESKNYDNIEKRDPQFH